jgi:predicted neuraminidase
VLHRPVILALLFLAVPGAALSQARQPGGGEPFLRSEFLFPLEHWHNHSSSVVELPSGDLFAVWYHGSGERTADDVLIQGARKIKGRPDWTPPQTVADTPGFPDCNPALFLDSKKRLWLFWPVILANEWHTALLKYRVSTGYSDRNALPLWGISEELLFQPRNFTERVRQAIQPRLRDAIPGTPLHDYLTRLDQRAGDKYFMRMGWMPRAHPTELPSGRILVPLYSDGYDFSLMAITDDGRTWTTSEPLPGAGNVQPSIVRRRDGTLAAYFRDNGPAPKRVQYSESRDQGITWSPAADTDLPNPGAGLEAIALRDGTWALIYNDTERERYSLAVALSDDEGRTWKWKRHLELDTSRTEGRASYHYPSILEAADGTLHATYSYFLNHLPAGAPRKTIKHAHFNQAWIKAR